MNIIGDITVSLPYSLDYCATGPDVEPIEVQIQTTNVEIIFPPSMSEGTVGQSFFASGWAWWTGTTLRIRISRVTDNYDFDARAVRQELSAVGNAVLRQFLLAYRFMMHRPDVFTVVFESSSLTLAVEQADGTLNILPEAPEAYFFNKIPESAPLESSVNATTLQQLSDLISNPSSIPVREQLRLDAEWLENLGDTERAQILRIALAKIIS